MTRRVVITGMGVAHPLAGKTGTNLDDLMENLWQGNTGEQKLPERFYQDSAIERIRSSLLEAVGENLSWLGRIIESKLATKVLARLPITSVNMPYGVGFDVDGGRDQAWPFDPYDADNFPQLAEIYQNAEEALGLRKLIRPLDPYAVLGLSAARLAVIDAFGTDYKKNLEIYQPHKRGTSVGTAIGPLTKVIETFTKIVTRGSKKIPPRDTANLLPDKLSTIIATAFSFGGPANLTVHACAAGSTAIGDAFWKIQYGKIDMVVAGGSEFITSIVPISGFTKGRAITSYGSRPFTNERDGFLPAEGSAFLIMEGHDMALARGAKIYGEIIGYGSTNDAKGKDTAPDVHGVSQSIIAAIEDADVDIKEIGYINAHGTSTILNDSTEIDAIKMVFGEYAPSIIVNSTKSMTGHPLGASGALESIVTIRELQEGKFHQTYGLTEINIDPECVGLHHIMHETRYDPNITMALNNAFGVGGQNTVLVFKKYEP